MVGGGGCVWLGGIFVLMIWGNNIGNGLLFLKYILFYYFVCNLWWIEINVLLFILESVGFLLRICVGDLWVIKFFSVFYDDRFVILWKVVKFEL